MRVLLINPPRSPHNAILSHAPEHARRLIHKKLIGPPLGLLTIAAAVGPDHDVMVFDMKGEYDLHPDARSPEALTADMVNGFAPDIVGVSCIASEYPAAMRILETAKSINSRILTVAGGLHATLCPHHFSRPCVDAVCPGMAAHTFRSAAAAWERGEGLERIRGILYNSPRGLRRTPGKPLPCNAADEDFIMPDRSHLSPWLSTYRVAGAPGPVTYLYTSLGCPGRCTFCSIWPHFDGAFYQRRIDSIIDELRTLDEYPVVRFADANTVVDTVFMHALFDRIWREGVRKEYVMDIRADAAAGNPDLIEKMARAGLKVAICGFESFREDELRDYHKGAGPEAIARAIDIFHANGVRVRGNYVVPPSYTDGDFDDLAAYAASHKVTHAGYTILTPMPGTALYRAMRDDIVDHDLSRYNFFNCVCRTALPRETFYERVANLWTIKEGDAVI
jgi:radical SAM superfamily enzyme YgiQ (UPF0313 family)